MLSSMISPYSSHRHTQLFKGKDKPDTSNTDEPTVTPSTPVADPADEVIFQSAQPPASEDESVPSSLLDKMLASWGFKSPPTAPAGKKVSFQNNDEGPAKSSTAGEPSSDGPKKSSQARLRKRVAPRERVKKATQSKPSPLQADDSGSPLAKTRSHGQNAPAKTNLVPIQEDDGDSILQKSIPDLTQFLIPPPQLPADLEKLPDFDSQSIKTPASSLWVEGTTGQASRMSSSFPPSRNPDMLAETGNDEYSDDSDADTESMKSGTSSAILVDDLPEVQVERKERKKLKEVRNTRQWVRAVETQQLGSQVAKQMSKADIHENKNYLPGDSGLNTDDEALYYDSEDGNSGFESDNQLVFSAEPRQPVPTESLLTKTVKDPKFNLVTQHQKLLHESKAQISESMATESRIQDEQRIHRLQQKYSPKQLADNYRKLQNRHLLIQSGLQSFRKDLEIPAYRTMTEQVDIWHEDLNTKKQNSTRELENLAAARRKGKMPEGQASSQWNALMQKRNKIEVDQQRVDSLLGRYNDLEAYGVQIKTKLALYQAAIARNRHQNQMNLLAQATADGLSHDEKMKLWQELGQRYPSDQLQQLKTEIRDQHHTHPTPKLEVLDQAIKYQDTMVRNILSRLHEAATGANHQQGHAIKLSQEFSKDFSRVELQEASQRIPQEKDLNRLQGRSILNEALFLKSEQQEN